MKILKREKVVGGVRLTLLQKTTDVYFTEPTGNSPQAIENLLVGSDLDSPQIQQSGFQTQEYITIDEVRGEIEKSLSGVSIGMSFPSSTPEDRDVLQFNGDTGEIVWAQPDVGKDYGTDIQDINNAFVEYESEFDSSYIKTRTVHFKFDPYARDNGLQWQDHDKPLEGYYGVMMGRGYDFAYYGPDQHGVGDLNSLVMRFSTADNTTPKGRGFLWSTIGGASPGYHPKMALDTQNGWLTITRGITLISSGDPMQAAPLQNIPYLNIVYIGHGPETANYVPLYDYNQQRLRLYPQSAITSGITGGPGTSELSGLTDVSLSALTNGHALTYNSATEKWQNSTPSEGVTDHELLNGLSGGSANNRYHLSELAYSALTSGDTSDASAYHLHGDSYVNPLALATLIGGYSETDHTHAFSAYSGLAGTGHTHGLESMTGSVAYNQIYSADTFPGDVMLVLGAGWSRAPLTGIGHSTFAGLSANDHPQYSLSAHTHTFSAITDSAVTLSNWLTATTHNQLLATNITATTFSASSILCNTISASTAVSANTIHFADNSYVTSTSDGQVKFFNKGTGAGSANTLHIDLGQTYEFGVTLSAGPSTKLIRFVSSPLLSDNVPFYFGNQSSAYMYFRNPSETSIADGGSMAFATYISGVSECSGYIEFLAVGASHSNWVRPNIDDPRIRLWSGLVENTTHNEWLELYHNRSNAYLTCGKGQIIISGASGTQIGNAANYVNITSAGTLTLVGSATTWDDLRVEPTIKTIGTNDPTFTKWFSSGTSRGVYLYNFTKETTSNQKEIFFNAQLPHTWKGTTVYPHIHFVPDSAGTEGDEERAIWGLEYTWADIGSVFGNTVLLYSTGGIIPSEIDMIQYKHYVDSFPGITPTTSQDGISSILICRLFRRSGDASDTFPGTCGLLYVDFHYEVDSLGSNLEYTK